MKNILQFSAPHLHRGSPYHQRTLQLQMSSDDLALLRRRFAAESSSGGERRLSKILVKVWVEKSSGPVLLVMSAEETVGELIKRAVEIYAAQKRRPFLPETDPHRFELHYSQFCFECLEENEKLINLGSRDFFLCSKRTNNNIAANSYCYKEGHNQLELDSNFEWTKLMELFLLY